MNRTELSEKMAQTILEEADKRYDVLVDQLKQEREKSSYYIHKKDQRILALLHELDRVYAVQWIKLTVLLIITFSAVLMFFMWLGTWK